MRIPLIAGNWKMYKTYSQANSLVEEIIAQVKEVEQVDILLCPPFPFLYPLGQLLKNTSIKLGGQNLFWEDEGAYTGEVSGKMLASVGCEYVIIGHSERRKYFGEKNETVNKKILAALRNNLLPIVCVGETLEEREADKTAAVIIEQLTGGFSGLKEEQMQKITIAYEPVWAIGTGKTATPEQAEEVHKLIRKWLEDNFSLSLAEKIRILYGGSVKPENANSLVSQENIDGALVGGASLKSDNFVSIIKESIK